jgi:hypothetical protein
LFTARRHKTIATLRADGAPRISGIECEFTADHLQFGSMPAARKLADLHRDPRFALHSPSVDPVDGREAEWPGEAKVSGRAVWSGAIGGEGQPQGELFVADVESVVLTRINAEGTKLVVEWWTPTDGRRRVERD